MSIFNPICPARGIYGHIERLEARREPLGRVTLGAADPRQCTALTLNRGCAATSGALRGRRFAPMHSCTRDAFDGGAA